ncbi:hypothetical protein [Actinomadura verrucosospora]|uniref:Uncharacterized protein n=1 Tax=Actinomadura verrucosospora TaxID=46165 RepID=A0A7D3ZRH0_ACTVE|nr:hypothetical protein [Actinomadura verrucosospora]QKG24802.1 hypothetical protein ACTIVE_6451 [Actinomadura verrucosospora]
MDLESELRAAMAEQVAGTAAPPSLVADVRRRHRRRTNRIRATVGVAAASVAALALVPTYQSFRATPAGDSATSRPTGGPAILEQPERRPASGLPASPSPEGRPEAGTTPKPSAHPKTGGTDGGGERPGGPGAPVKLPHWVTYLPGGLTAAGPCTVTGDPAHRTTTCRWGGTAGWVQIALVKAGGLGLTDLAPGGVPRRTTVRGMPALTGDHPGSGSQVSWIAKPGTGVTVSAGGTAKDQLMRIAEGVRP